MTQVEIIQGIIAVIGTVLTVFIVPLIKAKIGHEKFAKILEWVRIAVQAAEQMDKAGNLNEPKFTYVKKFLGKVGVKLSDAEIEALIESAVYEK